MLISMYIISTAALFHKKNKLQNFKNSDVFFNDDSGIQSRSHLIG